MTSLEDRLKFENREFREQLGSAMETANKLRDKVTEVRDLLLLYYGREEGMTHDEVEKILIQLNQMLSQRFRKCPRDTNGDGDCGRPACPHCGRRKQTSSTRQALDVPL